MLSGLQTLPTRRGDVDGTFHGQGLRACPDVEISPTSRIHLLEPVASLAIKVS